jgi:hypothetical protein
MQRITNGWVEARVPKQGHNVITVILSGIDEGRTVGDSLNPAQIFSNFANAVSSIVTYIEAGERW